MLFLGYVLSDDDSEGVHNQAGNRAKYHAARCPVVQALVWTRIHKGWDVSCATFFPRAVLVKTSAARHGHTARNGQRQASEKNTCLKNSSNCRQRRGSMHPP